MMPISNILKSKPDQAVYTISPTATVYEALKQMAEKNVGALLVESNDKIIGIISERDYARKIILNDLSSSQTTVESVMTSPVIYITPSQTNEECMALMTNNRLRHLPVMQNGKLVGLISIGDIVKDIISELKFSNDQLVNYINGSHARLSINQWVS